MEYAFFSKEVNPDNQPYHLVGFDERLNDEDSFGLPELYLKICWIKEGGNNLVFITLDTLYVSQDFTDHVIHELQANYDLKKEEIIFNASHTHSAPNISAPAWEKINVEYHNKIRAVIKEGFASCAKQFRKGFISFQSIKSDKKLFISRRKKTYSFSFKNQVQRLPNDNIDVDNSIRTITLHDVNGRAEVIIYNFPCHPTFNRNMEFSSDFVGVVSKKVEGYVKMAMFLQGFSGDVRANFYAKLKISQVGKILFGQIRIRKKVIDTIRLLKEGAIFIPYTRKYFQSFTDIIATLVINSKEEKTIDSLSLSSTCFEFTLISETGKTSKTFTTVLNKMNNHIIVAIPAEVNSAYYRALRENGNFFFLGCSNGMIGYLPFYDEIEEGGYEVDSYASYGWDSRFSKRSLFEYQELLLTHIGELNKNVTIKR